MIIDQLKCWILLNGTLVTVHLTLKILNSLLNTIVRPIMEYAAPVWDPYYNTNIYKLEKVQRAA